MTASAGLVDLHLHSTASDGTLSPEEVAGEASSRGLVAIALVDHDSVAGVDRASVACRARGIALVPGVELSADADRGDCHVLGYHVRHDDATFAGWLAARREGRIERGREIVRRVNAALRAAKGPDAPQITWDDVASRARLEEGGAVGRPHVAAALAAAGAVASHDEAFATLLGNGMAGDVSYVRVPPAGVIRVIRDAGGVAVLAHPTYLPDFEQRLPSLVDAGLEGIECIYGDYSPDVISRLVSLAHAHGLVVTGGSDFHGPGSGAGSGRIGFPEVSSSLLEPLAARAKR